MFVSNKSSKKSTWGNDWGADSKSTWKATGAPALKGNNSDWKGQWGEKKDAHQKPGGNKLETVVDFLNEASATDVSQVNSPNEEKKKKEK